MRTTVRLDDELLSEVKQLAAQSGQTLTQVIEDALREVLARRRQVHKRSLVKLTIVDGEGLLPGVDLDNSAALLELMERSDVAN